MTEYTATLEQSIFAVLDSARARVGVAFLVQDDVIMTCAHVITQAVGPLAAEGVIVKVELPLQARPDRATEYLARVEAWHPEAADGGGDIAVLRLLQPTVNALPVRLVESNDLWGHLIRTFGFPARREFGVWHEGVLRGRQAAGWVQIDTTMTGAYEIEPGFSGAPVWDPSLGGVVGMVVAADRGSVSAGYLIPIPSLVDAWPSLKNQAIPPSPYRGLTAFREEDAEFFFGREVEAQSLAQLVMASPTISVIGPSGSGKSSLVHAGLTPQLRNENVAVVSLRAGDGSSPLIALASAFLNTLEPQLSPSEHLKLLPSFTESLTPSGLHDMASRVIMACEASAVALIVDQAEQLLELSDEELTPFLATLFPDRPHSCLHVVVTFRADRLSSALRYPLLRKAVGGASFLIGGMSPEHLREAVGSPLERVVGVRFEAGLVDRICLDAGTDPGALPLLGNVLAELWERQQLGNITHAEYDSLGRLAGSLSKRADNVWETMTDPDDQTRLKRLFLSLVSIRWDDEDAVVRRTTLWEQLNDDSRALARRLITTRLIVAGQDAQGRATIELAHDALITHWARLREWVDADRGFRMWLDEFRTQASQWDRSDQSPDLLLRGVALRSAANWCRQRTQELSTIEMTYLDRSIESSKRTGRRRRLAIASIATAIVVILLAGLLAVNRGRTASIERAVASSRAYAAASESTVAEDFAKSALLAVLAYKTSPTVEAEKALFRSYTGAVGSKEVLSGWIGRRDDLSASADGHLVVAISHANDRNYLTVWTRDQGSPTRRKSIVIPRATDVNVTQDGAVVIISSPDGFHQIDPATEIVRNLTGPVGNHGFTDINRDGTLAVTANSSSGSTEYTVWNLHSGERVATKRIDHGEYPSGRPYMAADGSSVVLNYNPHGGIDRNTAQVWNYRTGDVRLLADEFHSLFVTRDGVAITCRISQPAAGNDPSKISVCWAGAVARNASLASMSDRIAALERKR